MPFEPDAPAQAPRVTAGFVPDTPVSPPAQPSGPGMGEQLTAARRITAQESDLAKRLTTEPELAQQYDFDAFVRETEAGIVDPFDPAGDVSAYQPTAQESFIAKMRELNTTPMDTEEREELVSQLTRTRIGERLNEIADAVQSDYNTQLFEADALELKKKFGAKTYRRWERGSAMVVGGALHLMEEIQKGVQALGVGDRERQASQAEALGDYARMYHNILKAPEMQPVVNNWFDKYIGGAVESGPFMVAALAPAAATGGASIPSSIGGFLTAYAVEGNNAYQTALDRGEPDRQARMRGWTTGLINGGIEVAGGSGGKFFRNRAITKTMTKLQKVKSWTKHTMKNALKEGLMEELPQEAVSMVVGGDVPRDKNGNVVWDEVSNRLIDSAIMGTVIGGLADASVSMVAAADQVVQETAQQILDEEVTAMATAAEEVQQEQAPFSDPAVETVEQQQERATLESVMESYGMTAEEAQAVLANQRAKGEEYTGPRGISDAEALSGYLQTQDKTVGTTPTQRLNRTGLQKFKHKMAKWVATEEANVRDMRRYLQALDGHENGPMYNYFTRLHDKSYERKGRIEQGRHQLVEEWRSLGFKEDWVSDIQEVSPGIELTTAQRIGVAMYAQNEHGARQVVEGMGIPEEVVQDIIQGLNDTEVRVMNNLQNWYESLLDYMAPEIQASGVDPADIKREVNYVTIARTDLEGAQLDAVNQLIRPFQDPAAKPEAGMLVEREPGAVGEIELDPFKVALRTVDRVEGFKAMAPIAAEFAETVNDPRFRDALNKATYGQGVPTLNKWIEDTVRGRSLDDQGMAARANRFLRQKTRNYLLAHNVVVSSIQWLSGVTAMAADKYVAGHMLHNMSLSPAEFRKIETETKEKSAVVRNRDIDRDFREDWQTEIERLLKGQPAQQNKMFKWIRTVDNFTVVHTWKALYDAAQDSRGLNMDDAGARKFADEWISKTQPMGDAVDLPALFRGGELAKTFTAFQRVPIQVWNTIVHDIIGETKAGNINRSEAARRAVVAAIIPSLLLSILRRGRPPKSPEELVKDLAMYPISTIPLAGSPINNVMRGFETLSPISAIPLTEAGRAVKAKDPKKAVVHGLKAVGAVTGKIPLQLIRTGEGAYDLATGETDDIRRLLYSEYALKEK